MFGKVLDTPLDILIDVLYLDLQNVVKDEKRLRKVFSIEINHKSSCISFIQHYSFEFDIR